MTKGKVLALDYGKKRIGVASGDTETKIAFPRGVIDNKGFPYVFAELKKLSSELNFKSIILGLPLDMEDGKETEMEREVRRFSAKLSEYFEVTLFDERLSSFEADELMRSSDKTTRDKKTHRDAFAAQVILQHFFDSMQK